MGCLFCLSAAGSEAQRFYPAIEGLGSVRSLDVLVADGAIHALLAGRFGERDRVAYLRSSNGGQTWSEPVPVDETTQPPAISRRGNDARLAVRGRRVVAVWQTKGDLPGSGPLAIAVSADGGKTWNTVGSPAKGDGMKNQSYPTLAADDAGNFHLAWLDDREENGDSQGLRYTRSSDGLRWAAETTLDPTVCTCCWSRMVALPDRSVALLYRDADPRDMRLLRGPLRDGLWRDLGPIGVGGWDFVGCPHCGGGLAVTGTHGKTVWHGVTWTGKPESPGLFYVHSADQGRHWSTPLLMGDEPSRESDIAAHSGSELAVVFSRATKEGTAVQVRTSRDGGRNWSPPKALTAPDVKADHPRVVAVPSGFAAFWTETVSDGRKVLAMANLSKQ